MKYYIIDATSEVFAFAEDGSEDAYIPADARPMTEEEIELHINPPPTFDQLAAIEAAWRLTELAVIARQLEAIEEQEDGYPPVDLLPGTRAKWRQYRGFVSNWNETNPAYPTSSARPTRPS